MTTFVNCDGCDIFDSEAQVLVNPVNCVGVMGAGLAKQFAQRFPAFEALYRIDCDRGLLTPGHPQMYGTKESPWVVMFPTKDHWRDPSNLEWVEEGLARLKEMIEELSVCTPIRSIAIPKLGCGLGGLNWEEEVRPLVKFHLAGIDKLVVELY